ncbi:MAG: hypothetical protein K2X46_16750 [Roseomonas sp.]|nr:hypothetical protein [Roseomonas sp.]
MTNFDLDAPCGANFKFRDLIEAGETWHRTRVDNAPRQPATIEAMRRLAEFVLDPVVARFGPLRVTYGFASVALTRLIAGRIDPSRDQHAGHEVRPDGTFVCPRLGQAVDILVEGSSSGRVAQWIAAHLPFDRIYFYGEERPLHVSVGPQHARAIVTMLPGPSGRRIPSVRNFAWLERKFG